MAYKTQELFDKALDEIKKKKLIFHEDVQMVLGIAKSTYYDHFSNGSDYFKKIVEALGENKVTIKTGIRNKWYNSKSDMGGLYLYKLCATTEEREILSTNYNKNELSGSVEANIDLLKLDLTKLSIEALREVRQLLTQGGDNANE